MFQRDYLLKMIEELAKALAVLAGLVNSGNGAAARKILEETYNASFGLKENQLSLKGDEMVKYLSEKKDWSFEKIEIYAKFLEQDGKLHIAEGKLSEGRAYLQRSLYLLQWLENETKTFSFERRRVISGIEAAIEELKP